MTFPYERYETLAEPLTVYHPTGEEERAHWIFQTIDKAGQKLSALLQQPMPELELLLVDPADWHLAPRSEDESEDKGKETGKDVTPLQPYWTDATSPPCIVIPSEFDPIFGEETPEKFAFMLYHELTLAFLEDDTRPWPEDYPLWADEWQIKFAALWLAHSLNGVQDIVNKDLREEYAEVFEAEEDGKTPVTVRGFDWYEDTADEDYLEYELLLEQFAADLLRRNDASILPRFLALYRIEQSVLLSDDVTIMLGTVLDPGGIDWLESLVYF